MDAAQDRGGQAPRALVPELRDRLLTHQQQTAGDPNEHDLVWHHRDGRPISHHDDHELWQALLIKAGVRKKGDPPIDQHRTRNTTLTLLLEAGVDAHVVDSTVGHSDVAVTRGYQWVDLSLARQAFANLAGPLFA
jgi:site-specific recombinase XerD